MYQVEDDAVLWKGKRLKDVSAAGFETLAPIIGRHEDTLFVLGKPTKIDATRFEILSDSYARDAESVYYIMPTKLKPLKAADVASFTALGSDHGHDDAKAFCQDKAMRLRKGKKPHDLRPLGLNFATDGTSLFHGTAQFDPPAGADLNAAALRFRSFSGTYDINMDAVSLTDGAQVWYKDGFGPWWCCIGADFDSLRPVPDPQRLSLGCTHALDDRQVWYQDTVLDIAPTDSLVMRGPHLLTDGSQLWLGARKLEISASEAAYVTNIHAFSLENRRSEHGIVLHHGARLVFHGLDGEQRDIASASGDTADLTDILTEIFSTLFVIFERYTALNWSPSDISEHLSENPASCNRLPRFTAELTTCGEICLTPESGESIQRSAAAWYGLACALWDQQSPYNTGLRPYPYLSSMQPDATDMQEMLTKTHRAAFVKLIRLLWQAGHHRDASILSHFLLYLNRNLPRCTSDDMQYLADLPRDLIPQVHYRPASYKFDVTTNLAVSRLIVRDGWLAAQDVRDQINVLNTLHGAILNTNKLKYVFDEITPALIKRYEVETCNAIKELIAFTIDASLISGQVACEVHRDFHHAKMLPAIRFCIQNGINVTMNKARLVEALWATDQDAEGDRAAQDLIAELGEQTSMSGLYCNRSIYRTARLWFLRAKCDIAWRDAPDTDTHLARLQALQDDLSGLIQRYGPESAEWEEIQDIRDDIERYQTALQP